MVGGKVGFLYPDKNEMPMVALHWEKFCCIFKGFRLLCGIPLSSDFP